MFEILAKENNRVLMHEVAEKVTQKVKRDLITRGIDIEYRKHKFE